MTQMPLPPLLQFCTHLVEALVQVQLRGDFTPEAVEKAACLLHGAGLVHKDWPWASSELLLLRASSLSQLRWAQAPGARVLRCSVSIAACGKTLHPDLQLPQR